MDNDVLAQRISAQFEQGMLTGDFSPFDRIGFLNVGYWRGIDDNMEMAQINLMETLISFFSNTEGTILDVGCGKGASTKFLTKYFNASAITGINVSEPQLKTCRVIAPDCNFKLMNATELEFEESSFDNVLCIEAAQHFMTRHKFFEEAHRVLKPRGRLAMLDTLLDYDFLGSEIDSIYPRENYLPDLETYKEKLLEAGFQYVRIDDCTELTGIAACEHVVRRLEREFGRTHDPKVIDRIRSVRHLYNRVCIAWGMVYAIK
jgi:MPBQ/MSBQ methyltransferase